VTELTYLEKNKEEIKALECPECRARFKQFIAKYQAEVYQKGQTFLLQHETPRGVFVIESGRARSYTIAADGREQLIAIHSSGEDVPVGYAVGLTERSQCFYEAYTKCVVRIIPREEFVKHLTSDPELMFQMNVYNTAQLLSMLNRINALEQPRAGNKIALTLVYLAERLGVNLWPKPKFPIISITQSEIADLLGLTRETASGELKKLQDHDIISYSRKNYTLNTDNLREYLESQ
jgi:CRP-like cAMP-binding protein